MSTTVRITIAFVAMTLCCLLALGLFSGTGETGPASGPVGGFRLSHDCGDVLQGDVLTHTFHLRNTTASDLSLSGDIDTTCGCTDASISPRDGSLQAGDELEVTIKVDTTRKSGRLGEAVTLRLQNVEREDVRAEFQLLAHVRKEVKLDPRRLDFSAGEDSSAQVVTATVTPTAEEVRVTVTPPFTYSELPRSQNGDRRYAIRFPPTEGVKSRTVCGWFRVSGSRDLPDSIPLRASQTATSFELTPNTVRWTRSADSQKKWEAKLILKGKAPDTLIASLQVDNSEIPLVLHRKALTGDVLLITLNFEGTAPAAEEPPAQVLIKADSRVELLLNSVFTI